MKHLDFDSILKQPSDFNTKNQASSNIHDQEEKPRMLGELQQPSLSRRSSLSSRLSQLLDKEEQIKRKLAEFDKKFGKRPPQINKDINNKKTSNSIENEIPSEISPVFNFPGSFKTNEKACNNISNNRDSTDSRGSSNRLHQEKNNSERQISKQKEKSRLSNSNSATGINPFNNKSCQEAVGVHLSDVYEVSNEGGPSNYNSSNYNSTNKYNNKQNNFKVKYEYNNDDPIELDEDESKRTLKSKSTISGKDRSLGNNQFSNHNTLYHASLMSKHMASIENDEHNLNLNNDGKNVYGYNMQEK